MINSLYYFGISQHIYAKHTQGHTLVWLISRTENDIVLQCLIDEFISDHCAIQVYLNNEKSKYSSKNQF